MAVALSRGLQDLGHEVSWTLLREAGDLGNDLDQEFPIESGLIQDGSPFRWVGKLRDRLRRTDALYMLDHQNAVVLGALAAKWARVKRTVVAVHTTGLWGGKPSLGRPMKTALRGIDAVLALSETHARYIVETEGVAEDRIRIVPNGIRIQDFESAGGPALRKELGLEQDDLVLGNVAMLRPEKNQGALLEAAASLLEEFPNLKVVLVGEGDERGSLEEAVRSLNLDGVVKLLGKRNDVASLLSVFDLFVLPSHPAVETQPVSVLEAMAAGVPVVATRVGDLEAMLGNGKFGGLVPVGDTNALTMSLRELLGDPKARQALALAGRKRVQDYSLEAAARTLESVFSNAEASRLGTTA